MWIKTCQTEDVRFAHVLNPEDVPPSRVEGIWKEGPCEDREGIALITTASAVVVSRAGCFPRSRRWRERVGSSLIRGTWFGPQVRWDGDYFVTV